MDLAIGGVTETLILKIPVVTFGQLHFGLAGRNYTTITTVMGQVLNLARSGGSLISVGFIFACYVSWGLSVTFGSRIVPTHIPVVFFVIATSTDNTAMGTSF